MYSIPITKANGSILQVTAMAMDKVTEKLIADNHELAAKLFPNIESWILTRPKGHIDLLVGIQLVEIHPYLKNEFDHRVGNL